MEFPKKTQPTQPKQDLVRGSWLKGGEASIYDVNKYFRRPEVRSDLKRRFKLPQGDVTQLDKYINQMMKMVPNRYRTGVIEKGEVLGSEFQRNKYWKLKHDVREKSKDGFTKNEIMDINRQKEMVKYIEEKFGK